MRHGLFSSYALALAIALTCMVGCVGSPSTPAATLKAIQPSSSSSLSTASLLPSSSSSLAPSLPLLGDELLSSHASSATVSPATVFVAVASSSPSAVPGLGSEPMKEEVKTFSLRSPASSPVALAAVPLRSEQNATKPSARLESVSLEPTASNEFQPVLLVESSKAPSKTLSFKSELKPEAKASSAVLLTTSETATASSRSTATPEPQWKMTQVSGRLLNYYRVQATKPLACEVVIQVNGNAYSPEACVTLNQKEVIRYRSAYQGETALVRAQKSAQALYEHLLIGGTYESLKVQSNPEEKTANLLVGNKVLATVDADTSQKALQATPYRLATIWNEQLRQSLGAPKPVVVASKPASDDDVVQASINKAVQDLSRRSQAKPSVFNKPAPPVAVQGTLVGMASWYGPYFHGRKTASGTRYNMYEMTAAHKTLPFGTKVRVTNNNTGKACVVTITDRGPYVGPRIIDLSKAAASAIGLLSSGVANVRLDILGR